MRGVCFLRLGDKRRENHRREGRRREKGEERYNPPPPKKKKQKKKFFLYIPALTRVHVLFSSGEGTNSLVTKMSSAQPVVAEVPRPRKLPEIPPEELALHGRPATADAASKTLELPPEIHAQLLRHMRKRSRSLTGLDTAEMERQDDEVNKENVGPGQDYVASQQEASPGEEGQKNLARSLPCSPSKGLGIAFLCISILLLNNDMVQNVVFKFYVYVVSKKCNINVFFSVRNFEFFLIVYNLS